MSDFHEVFNDNVKTNEVKLKTASEKEFSFIIDEQDVRRNYPFVVKDGTHFNIGVHFLVHCFED